MVPVFYHSDSPLHEDTTPPRGLQLGLGGELSCLELKVLTVLNRDHFLCFENVKHTVISSSFASVPAGSTVQGPGSHSPDSHSECQLHLGYPKPNSQKPGAWHEFICVWLIGQPGMFNVCSVPGAGAGTPGADGEQ